MVRGTGKADAFLDPPSRCCDEPVITGDRANYLVLFRFPMDFRVPSPHSRGKFRVCIDRNSRFQQQGAKSYETCQDILRSLSNSFR